MYDPAKPSYTRAPSRGSVLGRVNEACLGLYPTASLKPQQAQGMQPRSCWGKGRFAGSSPCSVERAGGWIVYCQGTVIQALDQGRALLCWVLYAHRAKIRPLPQGTHSLRQLGCSKRQSHHPESSQHQGRLVCCKGQAVGALRE